jgi:hypothetical protein
LANGITGYYYADITIAGNRTVTSPIWYTKTGSLPVTLLNFTALANSNRTVQLQWQTTKEINNEKFVIEKSIDGINFKYFNAILAKNDKVNNYTIIDEQPNEGINYYRLKQIDKSGKYSYSNIVVVNLKASNINGFSLVQNLVADIVKMNVNAVQSEAAKIIVTDVYGRTVQMGNINLVKGFQTNSIWINQLARGNYMVSLVLHNEVITTRFIKM